MYNDKKIAAVIPAFNEDKFIHKVLTTIPDFIDFVIVVDDGSSDRTSDMVKSFNNRDVILITHIKNQGVGSAIVSGYKKSLHLKVDITVVMGGDAQMDPLDMPNLLDGILTGEADYVKGNRLSIKSRYNPMPKIRIFGNTILTLLTRIVSGYRQLNDSQCGYTAINKRALESIPLDFLYKGYGYPNDILTKLNVLNFRVKDVTVKSIYGEENSGINIFEVTFKISILLLRLFVWRIWKKVLLPKYFSYNERLHN